MNILEILRHLNVPVSRLHYTGTSTTYITFFEYNQYAGLEADDEELQTVYSYQIDVFSKGNYINLVKQVKEALKNAGLKRTFETEEYERETGYFHKVLRYSYSMKNEEE